MSFSQQLASKYQINFSVWHCIGAQYLLQPLIIALSKRSFGLLNHFLLPVILCCTFAIEGNQNSPATNNPSLYISNEVWEKVKEYLIPDDHPIKEQLDQIFSNSRALANQQSMQLAGFINTEAQPVTTIVVTKHLDIPGYVFKAYLDTNNAIKNKPEYIYLTRRIDGARLVRKSITKHQYEHLFKVPQKWLYLLPDQFPPPTYYPNKMFILVEDDMDIFTDSENNMLWKSPWVTKELLRALHTVATEVGLADIKPANCPFSKDKRVAFVDTAGHSKDHIFYNKMTYHLSPPMQGFWKRLNKEAPRKSSKTSIDLDSSSQI